MSYSFLSDVFPNWKDPSLESATMNKGAGSLYENFEVGEIKMPQPPKNYPTPKQQAEKDLLTESFTDYNLPLETNRGPGPQPFDSTSDYFKILTNDWNKTVSKYQADARIPFGPKDYSAEEEQLGHSQNNTDSCINIAKHIDQCVGCRKRLEDIFRKLFADTTTTPSTIKSQKDDLFSRLADVLLLVGIGLFVIFVLDGFVKLGRYFRS